MPRKATPATLRKLALSLPETREDDPWGEVVYKVRDKVFVFSGSDEGGAFSLKLPRSGHAALKLPGAEPTGHNLGKSGWVTFREGLDEELLRAFVEESYRAVAPKKLTARLDGSTSSREG